jgi:hypothetical protein
MVNMIDWLVFKPTLAVSQLYRGVNNCILTSVSKHEFYTYMCMKGRHDLFGNKYIVINNERIDKYIFTYCLLIQYHEVIIKINPGPGLGQT